MAIYVRLDKLADDGRRATYSFTTLESPSRTLVFDREEDRIWPEDDNRDGIFRSAAQTVVKAWVERGELPTRLLHQA